MCITPNFVWVERGPKWERMPRPCGDCWQCKANRVNDYTGRCLAEASTSLWTCALTLTYAPRDDGAEKVLHPRHFQDFIRALRKRGHKIRYIAVGEYGKLEGRAHFHALLFSAKPDTLLNRWKRKLKQLVKGEDSRDWMAEWPHGHITADWTSGESAIRYVTKYLLKEDDDYWLTMSKKPPLGDEFFREKALRTASLGVLPNSFHYRPPGMIKEREYVMSGTTLRNYTAYCRDEYERLFGPIDRAKCSEWMLKALEKVDRWEHAREWDSLSHPERARLMDEQMARDRQVRSVEFKERKEKEWHERREKGQTNEKQRVAALCKFMRAERLIWVDQEALRRFLVVHGLRDKRTGNLRETSSGLLRGIANWRPSCLMLAEGRWRMLPGIVKDWTDPGWRDRSA